MAMFTTIAAGIGLAATAGTTAMSFAQAGKQRKLMKEAEKAADTAMQEARKKLDVNVYDKLAVNEDIYRDQRDRFSAAASEAIRAGVESERGANAIAGQVLSASNEAQAGITSAINQDLQQLEMLSAQEDARNRDIGVQLDLEEVAGAQLAAANAQELAANATAQGMQGLTSLGSQIAEKAPLFERNRTAEKGALSQLQLTPEQNIAFEKAGKGNSPFEGGNVDFSKVGAMDNKQYRKFLKSLTPQQRQLMFSNEKFGTLYDQLTLSPF